MARRKRGSKNSQTQKGWQPDGNLPKTYYDPITGNNTSSSLFGTPLVGEWEWLDGDTTTWRLTENSKIKAGSLGAESYGVIDVSHKQGVPENPWGSPMVLLDMYRSAYQDYTNWQWEPRVETRITDKMGSMGTGLQNYDPPILEATKGTGIHMVVFEYGGPLGSKESRFALLDATNTAVAWGII